MIPDASNVLFLLILIWMKGYDVNFLMIIHVPPSGVRSFMSTRAYVGNPWQKFPIWKYWITSKFILIESFLIFCATFFFSNFLMPF